MASRTRSTSSSFNWRRIVFFWQEEPRPRRRRKPLPEPWFNPALVFLRGLAVVYFFAFGSLFLQVDGLIGKNGILPAEGFLSAATTQLGWTRFFVLPSVAWLASSDFFLQCYCLLGVLLSVGLFWGKRPRLFALGLWVLYFSLVVIGRDFLGYQWDALLLEVGFLATWLSPMSSLRFAHASPALTWLFRLLLFRLIFSSGVVKWTSGDPLWQSWEALKVHYETQPLPTPIAWYVHQLPVFLHKVCTLFLFIVEVVVPIFFFFPRPFRHVAFWLQIILQGAIALTGNYTFFNFLTALLCLFLWDSPSPIVDENEFLRPQQPIPWLPFARRGLLFVWTLTGIFQVLTLFNVNPPLSGSLVEGMEHYFFVNRYGLFAVMTPLRYEVEIQGSRDGKEWKTYELPWKAGRLDERPHFVAPYQPRLDWQLWFAAQSRFEETPWLTGLVEGLLKGHRECLELFKMNPFPDAPPKYLRMLKYEYHFTNFKERKQTGNWWSRYLLGNYTPLLSMAPGG